MARRRAFALIELLVVISIIAMLMALLLPVSRLARKQAQAVACQAKLHQWAMVFQQYTSEHDGQWFPRHAGKILKSFAETTKGRYRCPGTPRFTWWGGDTVSYALNPLLHGPWEPQPPSKPCPPLSQYWRTVQDTRSPGTVPVYLDAIGQEQAWPDSHDEPPPCENTLALGIWMSYVCLPRHGSFVNGVFMDWSVRRVGLKELWTLKWHREYDTSGPWTKAGGVLPGDWPRWMRGFRDY